MNELDRKLGLALIGEYVPDFQKLRSIVTDMSNEISISRRDRGKRIEIYSSMLRTNGAEVSKFDAIVDIYQKIRSSEELMLASRAKQESHQTIARFAVAFGASGLLLFGVSMTFLIVRGL